MKKMKGIQRRWMVNSISAAMLSILLAVIAFSMAIISYYYSSLSRGLEGKIKTAVNFFGSYKTEEAYYQNAYAFVNNQFEDRDQLDFQILDIDGAVHFSSYMLLPSGYQPGTPDIQKAVESERTPVSNIFVWTGIDPNTKEHVMAVSCPLIVGGQVVSVLRMVTSLAVVDRQIVIVIGIALLVGLLVLLLIYASGLYFVRSIVGPVAEVTRTAEHIAAGSYGVQMEKSFDDEVGDLIDAINDMSTKIKQSEKMKNEFISSVSHELRTPLTAINGWAETIMNGEVRDAHDVKKGMGIIVSEARRLINMVEELLEFSRIQDGRFTLSIEPVDIKAELEDAVYTYREFFRREGIELTHTDCEEEFPLMNADPERLRQVFCNLLDNAAKHGGSGKRIDTAIWGEEEQVVITVRDYGPGIPEEELPHVKTRFYKGSSKARGSGIGLAVCEEIVVRHQGTLDIGNAPGGGCVATMRFPIGG
ncbi:sensor histidine kinase [Pseudoflavonifractor sp. 524-17]|uniref:sensor histidine kinase n=1 Tax=Pseudoflavonifractor sp. 524-17 TaxID=2304577 RepID=UPI00137A3639|nr:HAMP domain-containing sensor histidine kinase [Pseudoflavonifractor sp. 524-17]NCE65429.1 sensor histidine kinase [Pseudoflavonifractor sp. 524-17]